jgi:hypothetical protein
MFYDTRTDLIVIIILIFMAIFFTVLILVTRNKDKEDYKKCICSGNSRTCQDNDVTKDLYTQNMLTEYSDMENKGWSNTSPGDIDYPVSKGCNSGTRTSETENPQWVSWDFTQF